MGTDDDIMGMNGGEQLRAEWPSQYVLVNVERGSVVWYDCHDGAVRDQQEWGGVIINTRTADAEYVQRVIDNARKNM